MLILKKLMLTLIVASLFIPAVKSEGDSLNLSSEAAILMEAESGKI